MGEFKTTLGCIGAYVLLMTAAAVPINVGIYGVSAGIEGIQRKWNPDYAKKERTVATLQWQETAELLQTHGHIRHAMFSKQGKGIHAIDGMSVLEGKLLCNTVLPLQNGKKYEITVQGSDAVGYTLLSAKEVNK